MENTQGGSVTKIRTGETLIIESGGTLQADSGATVSLADGATAPADVALVDTHILVGNAAGVAADVALSGDATLARTGAITIGAKKVTAAKTAIADGKVFVGGADGAAAEQSISGDATLANTGALTVVSIGGKKIARGVHTQAAAADTVATGLATVVAAVASFQSAPTVKQLFVAADVGNQSGAPVAGSIVISTFKPTAVNDVTPTPATDFSENLVIAWVAVGT